MKKTMKFLTMAALALTGAVMTGCSNDDDTQQPKDNVVTLKTTVSISGGTTRALTTDGVKTFAAGEKIAVIYTNTSDQTVKVESEALKDNGDITTTDDASTNKKTATFTVTLTNPKPNGNVRYIYPAAMAATTVATSTPVTDDATVNYAALNTQNGTMANISANLDFAKFDGSLTASAGLPASPKLENQLAICEFTIKNGDTDITSTLTSLTMAYGGNTYTVSPPSSLSKIYMAVMPVTSGDITFTATDNATFNYTRTQTGVTLAAGNLYPISFKMKKEATLSLDNTTTVNFTSSEASGSTNASHQATYTGGTLRATSDNTDNCTVSVTEFGYIIVTRVNNAAFSDTQITVSVEPDENHTAPENVTFNVSAEVFSQTFTYDGEHRQIFTAPATGWYTLEAFGAQGGNSDTNNGGFGGYATIRYQLTAGRTLYIYVGEQGGSSTAGGRGGWNGGGKGGNGCEWDAHYYNGVAGGGGASHIATSEIGSIGSTISEAKTNLNINGTDPVSGLLLVAGGGGGAGHGNSVAGAGGGGVDQAGKNINGTALSSWNNSNYSWGQNGNDGFRDSGSAEGSGGGGGGFIGGSANQSTSGANQDYGGSGGSSWGDQAHGTGYSTTTGGATEGGNGKVVITYYGTAAQ